MKNLTALLIAALFISFAGFGCKNPLTSYTKQYRCELPGQPEPQNSNEYVERGWKHHEDNDYKNDPGDCALNACAEAVRLDPKNADGYFCRAGMYRDKGEYPQALADINEAIRLKPDNARFYGVRGIIYEDLNQYDKALPDLDKQIKLLGDNAQNFDYSRRGITYYELGKYEEAVKDFTEAIRLKPDNKYHYADRARTYEKLGQTELAEADKKKSEELDPASTNKAVVETPANVKPGDIQTISGGVLNDKAISLAKPVYPPTARAAKVSGAVNVDVFVDVKGEVVAASAVSGHPLLRMAAVQAARATRFKPTIVNGSPVKVTGVLVFNFKPVE